ncbi:MAG: CBS domain-containing protein [candidate division Zixibacteria bacterium]|nr:CBS domain-containing protein [candidate division Zixibacteria bacterium]
MDNVRVRDVLIPLDKYPHLPYWFTLRQAMAEMESARLEINGRTSLPRMILIFDEKYQLMGMARRRDILRGLEPTFLREKPVEHRKELWDVPIDSNLSEFSFSSVINAVIKRASETPISNVMLPIKATVNNDDHIVRVIYEMNKHNLSMLPVLQDDRIVGVVRSVDIFHEIAKVIVE